ncbi:hypothetical protein V5O48_014148, partial [Marasmius crinis-equi]
MSDSFENTASMSDIAYPYGDRLPENGILGRGVGLKSLDKLITLTLTLKGDLVLENQWHRVFWSVKGKDIAYLLMQTDGNCVAYTSHGQAVWATASNGGCHPYQLVCQNDGNLVVYGAQRFWSSGTADLMLASLVSNLDVAGQKVGGFWQSGFNASGFSQGGFQQGGYQPPQDFQPVPSNDPGFKPLEAKVDSEQPDTTNSTDNSIISETDT